MDKDTVKDLTLMLMYLTSWEENLVPELHEKPDRLGFRPQIRRTWKGYDFGILNELTDEGLVNARNRSKSASFTDEGAAKALELLMQYGITLEQQGGEEAGVDGTK
ncbi:MULTISPECIES: DUF6429 family protein [unclassified Anaerotruncus]|jgi:hypothetical protein|uniref:DUF6429 family protein n=1 Tax=unclassified Anaerotruncus TaxID=2641626 RepID=UPI00033C64F7|nr:MULTISPECIES: DUF6429 family protein [unclassified Anaerotruncus]EOS57385.1 hypothetical protein C814_02498 [Anaerotruncus sp. G3(2012)]NBK19176.1 hypothetical protein [Anaerotruncus sp. 1XD42-93]NCE76551.1 hypothetical protein [Anaerotruncus sp. X29]RKJ82346.1 hypothetical protein D7Y41_23855 [Anaerotruncus sp. 1XD22-93]